MRVPQPIAFEWDEGNVDKNWHKRNVQYREAEEVFLNKPIKMYHDTAHSQSEERYIALGATNRGRKLIISYTVRKQKIRIISARDQDEKEQRLYEA